MQELLHRGFNFEKLIQGFCKVQTRSEGWNMAFLVQFFDATSKIYNE